MIWGGGITQGWQGDDIFGRKAGKVVVGDREVVPGFATGRWKVFTFCENTKKRASLRHHHSSKEYNIYSTQPKRVTPPSVPR